MPRTEYVLDRDRACGSVTVEVTERYTLAQTLSNGCVIRHDGHDLWLAGGFSWHGLPPVLWDPAQAAPEAFARTYDQTYDVS